MVYDRTCTGDLLAGLRHRPANTAWGRLLQNAGERAAASGAGLGLSHSWMVGGALYSLLGRFDAWQGFDDWPTALRWLADRPGDRPIAEVQFWGHGKWGCARIGDERLSRASLAGEHPHHGPLRAIAARMGPAGLWWFRTCETFGAAEGHGFAVDFVDFMGCRAAGHTYVIGPWQSGLHSLAPGQRPGWSREEGLAEGSADQPLRAHWSRREEPNTVSCLQGRIPAGY